MSAKRHAHTFHLLSWTFGPYGRQDVHVHPCFDEDCDRVLIGSGRRCDGKPATHHRETLRVGSVPVRQGAAMSTVTALSRKQHEALYLLRLACKDDPNTDDGVMSSEATFYDKAVAVAFVHWRTARALEARGLVTYGAYDPDWGTELRLVDAGVSGAG